MTSRPVPMDNLAELIDYLKRENPDINQLCQFAVIRTFNFLQADAMFAGSVDGDGKIRPIGQFGYSAQMMKSWEVTDIEDDLPTADALKTNNIVWLADQSEWERNYPHLTKHLIDSDAKTFVAWPISVRGAYMSVLGVNLQTSIAPTADLISFFEIVGGLFALQLSNSTHTNPASKAQDEASTRLSLFTRRQRAIINLIAEGFTNSQIGNELGFSESTIRQETMRMYEILGASGRADAVRMYRLVNTRK